MGTGEKQRNRTCKLHKEVPCGSQLRVGTSVCFCKNQFAWRDEKDEDVLEVFVIKNGIQGCKVRYLPKHLAARADRFDGLCTRIVEIYSGDPRNMRQRCQEAEVPSQYWLLLGGDFGGARLMFAM